MVLLIVLIAGVPTPQVQVLIVRRDVIFVTRSAAAIALPPGKQTEKNNASTQQSIEKENCLAPRLIVRNAYLKILLLTVNLRYLVCFKGAAKVRPLTT